MDEAVERHDPEHVAVGHALGGDADAVVARLPVAELAEGPVQVDLRQREDQEEREHRVDGPRQAGPAEELARRRREGDQDHAHAEDHGLRPEPGMSAKPVRNVPAMLPSVDHA